MKDVKFDRRHLLLAGVAVSIVLAVLFGAYSSAAYSRAPISTSAKYSTLYKEEGRFVHFGVFSNNSIYESGSTHDYYPSRITRLISGNYTFRTSPSSPGTYRATMHLDYYVSTGRKKVYVYREEIPLGSGSFEGSFTLPVTFNMSLLSEKLKRVREGTGLYRAEQEVYVTVEVRPEGRDSFTQRIGLSKDSASMLYLTGTEKDYKKVTRSVSTTTNSLSFAGSDVKVSTARALFPAMAIIFAIPPIGLAYSRREKKAKPKALKSLGKYTVEGTPPAGRRVELKSAEDLERAFELVDRPIVHYRDGDTDVYAIADGETVYEYRAS